MSIYINIYSQYNNIDNIAIIPPFVLAATQSLRICRLQIKAMSLKLATIKNDDEKEKLQKEIFEIRYRCSELHKIILSGIPKATRDKLFDKRLS